MATDIQRIAVDLLPLCQAQRQVFGALPADLTEYWFLTWVVDNGYGGLEHRNSTLLLCNRFDLPNPRQPQEYTEEYQNFLALCSHEYFHTWNVKRIKPAAYVPYRLEQETYSPLLWLFLVTVPMSAVDSIASMFTFMYGDMIGQLALAPVLAR